MADRGQILGLLACQQLGVQNVKRSDNIGNMSFVGLEARLVDGGQVIGLLARQEGVCRAAHEVVQHHQHCSDTQ